MSTENGKCVVQELPVSDLQIDPRVNTRPLNGAFVEEIAKDFDVEALGVLHVSIRDDGTLSVLDGQTRLAALRRMGYNDQLVQCRVYRGKSVPQEAGLFNRLNNSKKPSRIARFMSRVTEGDKATVAINAIVRSVGLTVNKSPGPGHIQCVAVLEALYDGDTKIAKKADPRCILWTLECFRDAWGMDSSSFKGPIVHGLGLVFLRDAEKVKRPELVNKLQSVNNGAVGLEGRAKAAKDMHSRSLPFSAAGVITDLYNKGQSGKGRLQSWWS